MENKFKKKSNIEPARFSNEEQSSNPTSQTIDIAAIKEYERQQRLKAPPVPQEEKIDFEQWWLIRSPTLGQPSHVKDILKADARGRKLSSKETMERWDWAARQFGLKF